MPKKILFLLCLFSFSLFAQAQKSVREADLEEPIVKKKPVPPKPKDLALEYSKMVNQEDLKKHLSILASDEYGGRGTGQEGQKMAQEYIAKHFEDLKLPKIGHKESYYQPVSLINQAWGTPTITVGNKQYEFLKDFYAFGQTTSDLDYSENEVLFLGYGIEEEKYNDYEGQNVKGKTVMVLASEPITKNNKYLLTDSERPSEWSTNWRKKVEIASEKQVQVLLIVVDEIEKQVSRFGNYIKMGGMQVADGTETTEKISVIYISRQVADDILGNKKRKSTAFLQKKIKKKSTPKSLKTATKLKVDLDKKIDIIEANNLLGYIEGSDPKLKDELIIITAHYDHLGTDGTKIYNGADDDGSGTVAVLEMAQAFAQAKADGKGARRSILIMPVTGEEKGLLGSEFYADMKPIFPLENTVANLNVDMVGRIDNEHKDGNYIYIIGSDKLSSELHNINENMNKKYTQLALNYKYNDDKDPNRFYYRSDHYNFAKHDIPIIFYFNGTHGDYHKTTDTVDKINFEALEKRARLVFFTAWQLANQNKRIEVDKKPKK